MRCHECSQPLRLWHRRRGNAHAGCNYDWARAFIRRHFEPQRLLSYIELTPSDEVDEVGDTKFWSLK